MAVAVLALLSLPAGVIWITSTRERQAAWAGVFPHWLLPISKAGFKHPFLTVAWFSLVIFVWFFKLQFTRGPVVFNCALKKTKTLFKS